ncbi:MAG: efflux RND transporter periplasmic adaptor subunit [Verrucomicrobiae bacterium]|nr:efflux RND transporter periplasmic adaptor subunit [Verrucomicrobiae bacterium]
MKHVRAIFAGILFCSCSLQAQEVEGLTLPFKDLELGAPVQDVVRVVHVSEGDSVKAGQLLVELDDRKEALEIERALNVLDKRKFDSEAATKLFENAVITREEALGKQIDLELAKAELALAECRQQEKKITAPVDGIIVELIRDVGEPVDRAGTILRMVNIDQLLVQVLVPPAVASILVKGIVVPIKIVGVDAPVPATLIFVTPHADSSSGLFLVKLQIENPGHLIKAGIRVVANFGAIAGG